MASPTVAANAYASLGRMLESGGGIGAGAAKASDLGGGQSDSRLKSCFIHLYSDSRIRVCSWDKECASFKVEVRLAILVFGDWCYQSPRQSEIQG